jgi:hypothetical protein
MKKVRKRIPRQEEPRKRRYKLEIKRPKLMKTKEKMTLRPQEIIKNRQKPTIKKTTLSPMIISEALSDAGKLLVCPKTPARVKRVAASRLGIERFFRLLRFWKLIQNRKGKK